MICSKIEGWLTRILVASVFSGYINDNEIEFVVATWVAGIVQPVGCPVDLRSTEMCRVHKRVGRGYNKLLIKWIGNVLDQGDMIE